MTKFLALSLLLAAPAVAAPSLPPGEPEMQDPIASLQNLDRDLQAARLAPKASTARKGAFDEFREDLQLSVNGHEAEMEKLPLAPEDEEAAPRK